MQGLIRFFIKNSQFFLFLLLEIICLILVVNYNQKQRDIFRGATTSIAGTVYRNQKGLVEFIGLRRKMNDLSRENASLRRNLYEQKLQLRKLQRRTTPDSTHNLSLDSTFRFTPARVLSNSVSLRNNYLTLDIGKRHGIEPGMGVISPEGVVGMVTEVTPRYARVMSMLHAQFRLSAGLSGKHYFGTLYWPGGSPGRFRLKDIPIHAEIKEGDNVETSGFSFVFPEGIALGTIHKIEVDGYFYDLIIDMAQDLGDLHRVYVVDHPDRKQLQSLNALPDS